MYKRTMLSAVLVAATMGLSAQKPISAPAGGKAISDELIGIFFEDINNSADGGLYAELLQNGSFEFSMADRDGWGPGTAWKQLRPGHSLGYLEARNDNPVHANNSHSCVFISNVPESFMTTRVGEALVFRTTVSMASQ